MFDTGVLSVYGVNETQGNGGTPSFELVFKFQAFYEERTIGVTRLYSAMGANKKIDMLARIWESREAVTDDVAVLENGDQYRITAIQHLKNDDGLKVSDLTLERVNGYYDING